MLKDSFGRVHDYLRISLTDRCNLRCTYCMPEEHYDWVQKDALMSPEEIYQMAETFVSLGVKKIRLTGGEPLARKEFPEILAKLETLPVELSMTTNGLLLDRHWDTLKNSRLRGINISLDTLQKERFFELTRRDRFTEVMDTIDKLANESSFRLKVNVVAMKGVNEGEVNDFVALTKEAPIHVRFIEFMPFDGNRWQKEKVLSYAQILETVESQFSIEKLQDKAHATAKSYRVSGAKGTFAVISTVTEPFCSSCNRLRLTAEGKLRNCLFSRSETDLLTVMRAGQSIVPLIAQTVEAKHWKLGGLPEFEKDDDLNDQLSDRSMIRIGG